MEYIAFGFATLVWWTWPLMGLTVFFSIWGAHQVTIWQDSRREHSSGPWPCLAYLGTDASGQVDHWCWQRDGHEGEHLNQWGVPLSDFDDGLDQEWGEAACEGDGYRLNENFPVPSEMWTDGDRWHWTTGN